MSPLARLISLGILTTLIVALGITFYQVIAPFLLPLFLAWVTAILCRPIYLWFVEKTNGRPRLAAGLTTASLLLVVLLPLVAGTVFAAAQLVDLAQTTIGSQAWRERAVAVLADPRIVDTVRRVELYFADVPAADEASDEAIPEDEVLTEPDAIGDSAVEADAEPASGGDTAVADDPNPEPSETAEPPGDVAAPVESDDAAALAAANAKADAERLQRRVTASVRATLKYVGGRTIGVVGAVPGVALGVLGRVVGLLVALVMFAIGLYYFLCDGPELLAAAEGLIPVRIDYQRELMARFDQVVRAVVLSTFLSALAQGFLTSIALGFAGFDHLVVFFVLASLSAMIPLAGTWLVWAPCAIWLVIQGQSAAAAENMAEAYRLWGKAGLLAVFGIGVIGTVDNVIRTFILNNNAKLHPLLAFVSVLGGLKAMGLWGVFIAPVVAACLHALMQIFNTELKAFSQERGLTRHPENGDAAATPAAPTAGEPPMPAEAVKAEGAAKPQAVKAVPRPVATGQGGKRRKR